MRCCFGGKQGKRETGPTEGEGECVKRMTKIREEKERRGRNGGEAARKSLAKAREKMAFSLLLSRIPRAPTAVRRTKSSSYASYLLSHCCLSFQISQPNLW